MAENGETEQQTQTSIPPTPIDAALNENTENKSKKEEIENEAAEIPGTEAAVDIPISDPVEEDKSTDKLHTIESIDNSAEKKDNNNEENLKSDVVPNQENTQDAEVLHSSVTDDVKENEISLKTGDSQDSGDTSNRHEIQENAVDESPRLEKVSSAQSDIAGGNTDAEDISTVEISGEELPVTPMPSGVITEAEAETTQPTPNLQSEVLPSSADEHKEENTTSENITTENITAENVITLTVPTENATTANVTEENVITENVPQETIPRPPTLPEESNVAEATAKDTSLKLEETNQPLNLEWSFGLNRRVSTINLTDDSRTFILYAASHIAVLYDYRNNVQKLLQGHGNAIACMACSEDKRWLVTGDKGQGSCVIVWDSYTGIPVQTFFDIPGDEGVVAVNISSDAKFIVTVSNSSPQIVSAWDWTSTSDLPMHSVELDISHSNQTYVQFHPVHNNLFVTNSESQVIFYSWGSGSLQHDAPFLSDAVFNRPVGTYSQSIFLGEPSKRALTATSFGNIVVWDPDRPSLKSGGLVAMHRKRALKLVRMKDRGLTSLTQTDDMVVIGDAAGHVTFYDSQLNLINTYKDFNVGPINSISFNYAEDFTASALSDGKNYPNDATIQASSFLVRDFTVSTKTAEIAYIEADGTKVNLIHREHDAAVHALAASSNKPWICIGSYAGLLKIWDYETKKILVTRVFENKARIQCVSFNHDGLLIAVGMTSGAVHIVDSLSLDDEMAFLYSRDTITHCVFSQDSKYLATADGHFTTTVFEYDIAIASPKWKYLGRYRAHYEPIQDLLFGIDLDSNQPRLLSLGSDRVLVEYDLKESLKDDLRILTIDRIEQSAVPLCLTWYPPVCKETFLVTANDQYKMKLYNTTTKMCRKTLLGPTYGSPARLISIVPTPAGVDPSVNRLLCYATTNKVGIQLLPLDGNPHQSVSCVTHPGGVSKLACSYDGRYVFTAGGKEATVQMWFINRKALEAVAGLGGEGLVPFYGLLDGGRDGDMFAELENYFYYAQLRSQGINTTDEREASTVVSLDQIPFLMRALGYYPSEQEIEDMLNEVKFGDYVNTGRCVTEIDLADFIKLYINHRPAFGLSAAELYDAFKTLGELNDNKEPSVDRSLLLSILQRKGEHMTEYELAEYLSTLLGFLPEGGSAELGESPDHERASKDLEEVLPESIAVNTFAQEILGLNLYD